MPKGFDRATGELVAWINGEVWPEHRPGGSEGRLLVANLDVPPHEEVEELPVRPQLVQVRRETSIRFDDD